MRKKPFVICIVIGVIFIFISFGILFVSNIRQSIHENEIIVHTGTVYDFISSSHFVMDRNNGIEYDKTLFVDLDTKVPISVNERTTNPHVYKNGEVVTIYEWNGDYALNKGDLFLTWYPKHLYTVFFVIGFMMVSMPIHFIIHKNDD